MKTICSDFVRSLAPDGEPSDGALDTLWKELRRLLRRGLQARGLWDRPPAWLGVPGHPAWTAPETADRRGVPTGAYDPLDELTLDFYQWAFLERQASLRRYVDAGREIEKVVRHGVRQFLHERQKGHDPLGFRLFQWLRSALRQAVDDGRLAVVSGDSEIANDTVLAFDAEAGGEPATDDELSLEVRRWNDELLLDWVSARGAEVRKAVDRLATRVLGLRDAGVEVFGCKTLVDVMKRDARARLSTLWDEGRPSSVTPEILTHRVEADRVRDLSRCVEAGIGALSLQERVRDKLLRLWRFLAAFALETVDPVSTGGEDEALRAAIESDSLPSNRALSRLLDIHHDRFPDLFARLRSEVERCLSALRERAAPATLAALAGARGPEASVDERRNLRQELKRKTAEAFGRQGSAAPASAEPRIGDLHTLAACSEPGIEWLVLELEPTRCLVVPADTVPWVGSSDVALDGGEIGPLSVRCGHGVWIAPDCLGAAGGSAGAVEAARTRRREWLAGEVEATEEEREVDVDPDYRDWVETLEAARAEVVRECGGQVDGVEPGETEPAEVLEFPRSGERPRARPRIGPYVLLAASITGLVVGAGGFVVGRMLEKRAAGAWIAELEERQRRLEEGQAALARELESEQQRFEHEKSDLASRHREEVDAIRELLEAEKARVDQAEVGIPWLLALGVQRSGRERLPVPADARSIGFSVYANEGDRIEIKTSAGKSVWSGVVGKRYTEDEVVIRLPAPLLPPDDYDFFVWRGDRQELRFPFRIERP